MSAGKWLDEAFKNVAARITSTEQRLEGMAVQSEVTALKDRHEALDERVSKLEAASASRFAVLTEFLEKVVHPWLDDAVKRATEMAAVPVIDRLQRDVRSLWTQLGKVYDRVSAIEEHASAERVRLLSERVTALERVGVPWRTYFAEVSDPARGLKPLEPPMTPEELALSYKVVPAGTVADPGDLWMLYNVFVKSVGQVPNAKIDIAAIERAGQLVTEVVRRRLVEKDAPG